ncbi:hypothetical protein KK120_08935 [Virgibacillus dakarensis]|nr:hypothetical protein [Virgibacillus dakarensis]MBT2215947.1 hypothetical protein [Virgibacillus dakarensis]
MLKDHYLMQDMDKVLEHIENIMNASVNALKAAETANDDLATDASFQITYSLGELTAYHRKKKRKDAEHTLHGSLIKKG